MAEQQLMITSYPTLRSPFASLRDENGSIKLPRGRLWLPNDQFFLDQSNLIAGVIDQLGAVRVRRCYEQNSEALLVRANASWAFVDDVREAREEAALPLVSVNAAGVNE
eukprot:6310854-Prymnesium_polylepis.1